MRKNSKVTVVAALVMAMTMAMMVPAASAGGEASNVVRNDSGVSMTFHVEDLTPGNVLSAWVSTNGFPGPTNPAVSLAGMVVGGSGKATFAGHIAEGGVLGLDPAADTVFIIIVDHGPKVPGSIRQAMLDPFFCGGGTCGPVTHVEHAP